MTILPFPFMRVWAISGPESVGGVHGRPEEEATGFACKAWLERGQTISSCIYDMESLE